MDEERVGGFEGWKLSFEANSLLEREVGRRVVDACLAPEMRRETLREGSFDGSEGAAYCSILGEDYQRRFPTKRNELATCVMKRI
jgi:hypothetical protein